MVTQKKVTIRLAEETDFESIFSIWHEGISNSFDIKSLTVDELKEKLKVVFSERRGIFNFWVAVDVDKKIIGWQSLIKCFAHPFKKDVYAESSTYVKRCNGSLGLGELLLDFVIREAQKSSLEYIVGFVSTSNTSARKITSATGWINIGEIPPSIKRPYNIKKMFIVRPL